jgi:glycerate kinase
MLSYLGIIFYNAEGNLFIPTGNTLKEVKKIQFSDRFKKYQNIKFKAMCDVTNPLFGVFGCSYIFACQKGADDNMIKRLDQSVRAYSKTCEDFLGKNYSLIACTGAAGGLGFACKAFLNAELISGINTLLDLYSFDKIKEGAI